MHLVYGDMPSSQTHLVTTLVVGSLHKGECSDGQTLQNKFQQHIVPILVKVGYLPKVGVEELILWCFDGLDSCISRCLGTDCDVEPCLYNAQPLLA